MSTQLDPLSLSADLLYAVTTEGGDPSGLCDHLATLERAQLARALSDRTAKLAFWLNCYNAYVQLRLESESESPAGSHLERWKFLTRDRVPIAGSWLSLNDIKHGLLRRSKHPWGLGYLPRLVPSSFERQFRLPECDARIHFALSHGAESCPPIAVYSPADVDADLDIAVEWYVEENTEYDPDRNHVTIPRLFRRYQGDFGGRDGIVSFLESFNAIPAGSSPTLEYGTPEQTTAVDIDGEADPLRP
ncbi:DUF547 domain-containing protein [Natronolimnobius sp. AArcel1]|uniref:DUF547 domain-containing protein n=1 Tax=Natronolimnobius sp. AArcel1 TaxID=1679093 RepID=UPI0013ED8F23|nr:DUF547 domain-containing protein [Natronolimnobius sp. AArcel1]NGM68469.1 DUF547 domain-containing protein [Natronolimnobius sp. AArcel1]